MSLALPKVLTSTQNTARTHGCLSGGRPPGARCTLCPSSETTRGGRHRKCCVGLFQAHKWRTRKVCWLTEIVVAPRGSAGWLVGNDLSLAGSISSCQSWRGLPPIAPVVRGVERTGRGWSTPAGGQTNREGHDVVLGAIHLTKQEGNNSRVHQFMFK